eukprot:COSAG05_NODE_3984_length_1738_cov_2.549725_1_plen_84_part_00
MDGCKDEVLDAIDQGAVLMKGTGDDLDVDVSPSGAEDKVARLAEEFNQHCTVLSHWSQSPTSPAPALAPQLACLQRLVALAEG